MFRLRRAPSIRGRGETLKEIGSAARREMELLLGTKVFLYLRVKVLKEWQGDPKALDRLGL